MAKVVTDKVRFSFCHLFEPSASMPGQEPKYSITVLLPKSDTATYARIQAAIEAAIEDGKARKWDGKAPARPMQPVYDGDGLRPNGEEFGSECKGCWVFTASAKEAPEVIDASLNPVIDKNLIYSGCYGRVSVNFFPYSAAGRKGIGCGLNNVQYLCAGERLGGGKSSAVEDFGKDMEKFAEFAKFE